jgi:hypothetical protein
VLVLLVRHSGDALFFGLESGGVGRRARWIDCMPEFAIGQIGKADAQAPVDLPGLPTLAFSCVWM